MVSDGVTDTEETQHPDSQSHKHTHTLTNTHVTTIMRRKQRQLLRAKWGRERVLADRQATQSAEVVHHVWTSPHYYSEHKLNQLTNR